MLVADDQAQDSKREAIESSVSHILEEARMVLPGIQALLGFQLVAVFNQTFSHVSTVDKGIHLAAIFLSVNAICFLLTPAALHRQCNPDKVTRSFAEKSSWLICMGMMPLLLSIVLDTYVVCNVALNTPWLSLVISLFLFAELLFCWLIWPQFKRNSKRLRAWEC